MAALNKDESELVGATQAALAVAKEEMRDAQDQLTAVASKMRKMAAINRDAGRLEESNAAMRLEGVAISARGLVSQALGDLICGHADASDALAKAYDDGPEIVVFGGGGR